MTDAAARTLVRLGGRDLDRLRADASAQPFTPVALDAIVSGRLTQRVQRQTSPNVIGFVRGTNPGQAVIYTAHYDHLGIHPGQPDEDRIYNGALDNASGVAGMLAMAEAYARAAQPPGRSVYFVATTAEEAGLLGSEYLAAHPPLAIDQVAANINVDGLNVWGRSNDIVLLGAERSSLGTMADRLAAERGRRVGQDPEPERGYFFRSDHFPLAKAGVPAVSISDATDYPDQAPGFAERVHTRYVEQDYHQPSDEYDEAWRYDGAVADLAFLAELGWRVAAAAELPAYRAGDQFRRPRDGATP
jgi:Zn-dependent M28 family amino/carboxypeptidase